jgi:hypothetical protein
MRHLAHAFRTMPRLGSFVLLVGLSTALFACGAAAAPSAVSTGPAQPPCPTEDYDCRVQRLGDTSFGAITNGATAEAIVARLGEPTARGETQEEGASGLFLSVWEWPAAGVVVTMESTTPTGALTAHSFTLRAPCAERSTRGVGVGSTEAEVSTAYAGLADPDATRPGETFVAGSVYGGVFFTFVGGRVSEIFVGAGAE